MFNFPLSKKLGFYLSYIYYRIRIPLEVKKGRSQLLIIEFIWVLNKILKNKISLPKNFYLSYCETIFGKFFITPDLISNVTVSPAFERPDIEYLSSLIRSKRGNKLFIDIGANFGLYTIIFGKRFSKLDILAFEPGTEYLSLPAYDLLKKNVRANKLRNVKLFNIGIGSKNGKNDLGIKIVTLDSIIKSYSKYDSVFIKLDIDDFVIDGLRGIQESVDRFKETYLLVEDFVKPKAIEYLKESGYEFIAKLTPYNSFWIKR